MHIPKICRTFAGEMINVVTSMRKIVILFLCVWGFAGIAMAKSDVQNIKFTYTYYSDDKNESPALAEQRAIEHAKQEALKEKFGVDVSSIVVNMEHERASNGDLQYDEDFFSLGGSITRGEWLKCEEKVLERSMSKDGFMVIKVSVEGTAREKGGTSIDIRYAFVNDKRERDNRTKYYDGDDLYMRFSSPVSGYLCVYCVDAEKTAFCLLPYEDNTDGYQKVAANKDYLFFDRTDSKIEGITLTTPSMEHNVLYVVFSPNRFTKARDAEGGKNWRDEQLPRMLKYADFLKWLAKNQTADEEMIVKTEVVEIRKR